MWISASFCYYLIAYQLKYIKGDTFTNGLVSSGSECLAYVVSGLIFKIIGLKATLGLSYTISLIGMLSLILVKTENKALLSLFVLGSKFGVS